MHTLFFVVRGVPKGQPRARAFAFNGKARMYDPGTAEGWKSCVALAARDVQPTTPLDGPVCVSLTFGFPRPAKHYGSKKRVRFLKDDAPTWHTSKPDADNLAKAVLDALTQLGWWKDDAQVARLDIRKTYSTNAGCEVTVWTEAGR